MAANPNHPKVGDNITVEPIRKIEDIKAISKMLADTPRDLLLFTMGINTGLRTGDLLRLKVGDVKHMKPSDTLPIRESKTGKDNVLVINKMIYKALSNYLSKVKPADDAPLFPSRKGDKALTVGSVNKLVKKWTADINLKGKLRCP